MLEWKQDKTLSLIHALCQDRNIEPANVPGYNIPPPHPLSPSPSPTAQSSPGLAVASLALSDAPTIPSSRSSKASGKSGKSGHPHAVKSLTRFRCTHCSPIEPEECGAQPPEQPHNVRRQGIGDAHFLNVQILQTPVLDVYTYVELTRDCECLWKVRDVIKTNHR